MLTDRISLVLAYNYLKGVKDTYAASNVLDVTFRYSNNFSVIKKTSTIISDLSNMPGLIDELAPPMTISEAECPTLGLSTMGLYELRSFTIKFNTGNSAILQNKGNIGQPIWNTSSSDVFGLTIDDLNEYQLRYNEITNLYLHVYDNEYINKQLEYVDCKYIQILFGPIIDQINEKYKNPKWHLKG